MQLVRCPVLLPAGDLDLALDDGTFGAEALDDGIEVEEVGPHAPGGGSGGGLGSAGGAAGGSPGPASALQDPVGTGVALVLRAGSLSVGGASPAAAAAAAAAPIAVDAAGGDPWLAGGAAGEPGSRACRTTGRR